MRIKFEGHTVDRPSPLAFVYFVIFLVYFATLIALRVLYSNQIANYFIFSNNGAVLFFCLFIWSARRTHRLFKDAISFEFLDEELKTFNSFGSSLPAIHPKEVSRIFFKRCGHLPELQVGNPISDANRVHLILSLHSGRTISLCYSMENFPLFANTLENWSGLTLCNKMSHIPGRNCESIRLAEWSNLVLPLDYYRTNLLSSRHTTFLAWIDTIDAVRRYFILICKRVFGSN